MRPMLRIESRQDGVLLINGVFCGPVGEGQTFPAGRDAEVYVQLFPYGEEAPLTAYLQLRAGRIETLAPQENAYALMWPGGVMQMELRGKREREKTPQSEETAPEEGRPKGESRDEALLAVLMRMLAQERAGSGELAEYEAAVPLRFGTGRAEGWVNAQAGLLRREAENVAAVDAAMARLEEGGRLVRMEIRRT